MSDHAKCVDVMGIDSAGHAGVVLPLPPSSFEPLLSRVVLDDVSRRNRISPPAPL